MGYKITCIYCECEVVFAPGSMLIENGDMSFAVHEECYQMSGDDDGYVERMHQLLDEEESGEDLFSVNS
jgi:hypothetical protein